MHYARRPLIGSASGGAYRHGTRTSTKIRPDHGSALRGPDNVHEKVPNHMLSGGVFCTVCGAGQAQEVRTPLCELICLKKPPRISQHAYNPCSSGAAVYLASIAWTSVWRQRTVICTSWPNAVSLWRRSRASFENKLQRRRTHITRLLLLINSVMSDESIGIVVKAEND